MITPEERVEIQRRAAVLAARIADKPVPDSVIQILTAAVRRKYAREEVRVAA